jgi:hypothetical protein
MAQRRILLKGTKPTEEEILMIKTPFDEGFRSAELHAIKILELKDYEYSD